MGTTLVTGGCGFIGSNFVRLLLQQQPEEAVVNLDALTYAGNLENLAAVQDNANYQFVHGSVADPEVVKSMFSSGVDRVVHFAAESHVDRSLYDAGSFVETNVRGTQILLDAAREHEVKRFLHVSTDEVYGSLGEQGVFTEDSPLAPNSPYSASKAGSDLMVRAYNETFGLPTLVTRSSNNYGPYQFPEKLIPLFITNARNDQSLPVYGDGQNVRDWIHVQDNCEALLAVLERGEVGRAYNVGGRNERTNLQVTKAILDAVGKPESLITYVDDRPGHDRRYALSIDRISSELGWEPKIGFEEGLKETVDWYLENEGWWSRVKSGEYREYYEKHYSTLGLSE